MYVVYVNMWSYMHHTQLMWDAGAEHTAVTGVNIF